MPRSFPWCAAGAVARKMRIAALINRFPSPSQTFVLNQLTGLEALGCDLEIFADGGDITSSNGDDGASSELLSRARYYGIPAGYGTRVRQAAGMLRARGGLTAKARAGAVNALRYGREAASLRLLFEANALARRPRFDVLHGHFGPSGLLAVQLRDLGAVSGPVVTSFYGYDISRAQYASRYALLFRRGDRFIAISEQMRDRLIAWGCDAARVTVHRLGIDLRRFVPAPRSPGRVLEIISVARFVPKKGLEYGLRAVAALTQHSPAVRYTIVGDGPLRQEIEALARELKLGASVRLLGWRSHGDIVSLMQQSDVLLAPSITAPDGDAEGTPVSILEAQALALPVVSTLHEGIPEMVEHGVSGLLAPERDVRPVAAALRALLEAPAMRRAMGDAGRQSVVERHDIAVLNRNLLALYETLAGRGRA